MLVEVMMGARSLDRSKSLIRWPTSKSLFCCADIKHERNGMLRHSLATLEEIKNL